MTIKEILFKVLPTNVLVTLFIKIVMTEYNSFTKEFYNTVIVIGTRLFVKSSRIGVIYISKFSFNDLIIRFYRGLTRK